MPDPHDSAPRGLRAAESGGPRQVSVVERPPVGTTMRALPGLLVLLVAAVAAIGYFVFRSADTPVDVRTPEVAPPAVHPTSPSPTDSTARSRIESPVRPAEALRGIGGVVTTWDGHPIAAAEVRVFRVEVPWPDQHDVLLARVLSGQDGRFHLAVDPAAEIAVTATAPGYATTRVVAPPGVDTILVRMEQGFDVDGVVVGPNLRPLPDCPVALEPGPWSGRRAELTRTDADGRFRFHDIPAGQTGVVRITAHSPPNQPAGVSSYPVGSREPVRIQFLGSPGVQLLGRVVRSGAGTPVEGATVRVFPSTAWNARLHIPFEATTDVEGRYQIAGLSLGNATVEVTHPELSATTRVVTIGRGVPKQSFELVRRSSLELQLSGAVAPGIRVVAASTAGEVGRGTTDAQGIVRFEARFSVGPATLEIIDGERVFARSSGRALSVAIEDGGATVIDLELLETGRIAGRVLDSNGDPVARALVSTPRFRFEPRNPERWYAQSDERGQFELLGLPAGSAQLRFEHPDFAPFEQDVPVPAPGTSSEVEFRLPRAGVIRGQVARGGQPLAGVTIVAGRDRNASMNAVSDLQGNFELRVAPGRYRVLARYSSLPVQVSDRVVQVDAGGVVEDVRIAFPPGRRLRGTVAGAESLPVPDAYVFVAGLPGALSTTDQNGRFDLEVPEGDVELQVFSPNFQIQVREAASANARDVTIRLPWIADGTISGMVVAMPGMRPLGDAILRLRPLDESTEWDENVRRQRYVPSHPLTLNAGRFVFDRAPAGRSRVEISAPGYAPFVRDIELTRGGTVDLDIVRLEAGAEVRGVVHAADGSPIVGAFVLLGPVEDLQFDFARRTMTDAHGGFRVQGVSPASRKLLVSAAGFASRFVEIEIPGDLLRADPLPIELPRQSRLTLRIVRGGTPVTEYHWLSVRHDGALLAVQATDAEGVFDVPIQLAGRYTIAVFGREQDGEVEVDFGFEPVHREVTLEVH